MFCNKCNNEIQENRNHCQKCQRKDEFENTANNYYLIEEDIVLVSVPMADMFGGPMMISVFAKKDDRRNYKGYDYILRPSEFAKDPNKEMHIHVLGEKGSMKVRLNPVERDTDQPTSIPPNLERKLIKFINDNIIDIKRRIREELEKRNIKVPPF